MKGLNERLSEYTGSGRDQVSNYDKLANMYGDAVAKKRAEEASWENEDNTSEVKLAVLQKMIAEEISQEAEAKRAAMPVISKFEAYNIAKKANDDTSNRDAGIRMLSSMLKKHWAEDKSGDYLGETVDGLRKYFSANYPKSRVAEVFEIMADSGYSDLSVNELLRIAENVVDQESFEYEVRRAGLDSSAPAHKKARKFILAAVNTRESQVVEKQDVPDFEPERQDVLGEDEEEDKE